MGRRKGKRLEKHDAVKEELICAGIFVGSVDRNEMKKCSENSLWI